MEFIQVKQIAWINHVTIIHEALDFKHTRPARQSDLFCTSTTLLRLAYFELFTTNSEEYRALYRVSGRSFKEA